MTGETNFQKGMETWYHFFVLFFFYFWGGDTGSLSTHIERGEWLIHQFWREKKMLAHKQIWLVSLKTKQQQMTPP